MSNFLRNTVFWCIALAVTATAKADVAAQTNGAERYFGGLSLVDQNGNTVDLYRDAIADHVVVIHSFYTNCTSSCPVTMNTLKTLQSKLGDRLGQDARLLSISVDPARDTPAVLKAYAQRVQAKHGWLFLTGTQDQVTAALKRIGQYVDEPTAHMDLLVAGNARTGLWKKILGMAPTAQAVASIMGVVDDAGEPGTQPMAPTP